MPQQFITALKEHAQYISGAFNGFRKEMAEQFTLLRKDLKENNQKIQLDLTPRAIEQLQDNASLDINRAVKAIKDASSNQANSLQAVTVAVQAVTEAIRADTSEAHLLRQNNQQLSSLSEAVEKLIVITKAKDDKEQVQLLKDLRAAIQKLDKDEKETDLSPVTNALKMLITEIKDMAHANNQAFSSFAKGMTTLGEAVGDMKFDFPKEFKLDEQQVRKIASGSRGVTTIPTKNATDVTIANVAITNSGTEYSYTFPANTVSWTFKLRAAGATLYYAFNANNTPANGSTYMTLLPGLAARSQDNLEWSGKTIYFESDTSSQVVEIEIFTL